MEFKTKSYVLKKAGLLKKVALAVSRPYFITESLMLPGSRSQLSTDPREEEQPRMAAKAILAGL